MSGLRGPAGREMPKTSVWSYSHFPVNRIIMPMRNNAELTFEPQFAPPQCILWAIFGGFPGFPRVPGKPTEK